MNREKRQKRFQQKKRHIERQATIYENVLGEYRKWIPDNLTNLVGKDYGRSNHRFHKRKALNCGDPKCVMCMNPRKAFGEKTMQERRFECLPAEAADGDIVDEAAANWHWDAYIGEE
jgi:hypothetical protein